MANITNMTEDLNKISERFLLKRYLDFDSLPDKVKQDFADEMIVKRFKKGQTIFAEGAYPAGIYFIKEGKVKKFKNLNGGKEQIIYLSNAGELIGYAAYLSEERYPDSAAAIIDSLIGFVPRERLIRLLDKHEELSKLLLKKLSHEFGVLINFIATFTKKSVRERVALTLLILFEKFSDNVDENGEVLISLTREDFANIVGTAVETLVRILHDFEKEKLIQKQGRKIIVKDRHKLFTIADLTDTF